jgi:hypothetical protein
MVNKNASALVLDDTTLFKTVRKDGEVRYWTTDDLTMDAKKREELESTGWGIEVYLVESSSAMG